MMRRFALLCGLLVLAGCSAQPASNPELAQAHEVLKSGLEAWKGGNTPAALSDVQFTDADWQAGAKLSEYRILKVGGEDEGETVATVALKLSVRGKAVDRTLSYRVTLTPKRTVTRSLTR